MSPFAAVAGSLIGVDVGSRTIKAIQLRRTARGHWTVRAAARFPRAQTATGVDVAEAVRLRGILRRKGFSGNRIALAVPREMMMTDLLELPPRKSGAPLHQIARVELARLHGCNPDAFEMTCWDLPAVKGKDISHVLAVACAHEHARAILAIYEEAGFDVQVLDARACAMARACKPLLAGGEGVTALLDIGWSGTNLQVLYRDLIIYQRQTSDWGIGELANELRHQCSLDREAIEYLLDYDGASPAAGGGVDEFATIRGAVEKYLNAMAEDLQAPFAYATQQYATAEAQRVLLVGGGAMIRGIAPHLAQVLGVEVQTVSPVDLARVPNELLRTCGPFMTAAMGLATSPQRIT